MQNQKAKTKLSKFLCLPGKMKLLMVSTFFVSGIMRLFILFMPYKKLFSLMGKEGKESPPVLDEKKSSRALKVGWAVNTVCNHTPWESKCYVRSLTAQFILRVLGIPSTIYMGVAFDEAKNIRAHAWLKSGPYYLTGENEMNQFKCITQYSTQIKST